MKKKEKTETHEQQVAIPAPKIQTAVFKIQGKSPYMQARFSYKAMKQMQEKMEAGSTAKVRKNDRAFQTGDTVELVRIRTIDGDLELHRMDGCGERIHAKISYILQGGLFGIESGYCVLQLEDISILDKVEVDKL